MELNPCKSWLKWINTLWTLLPGMDENESSRFNAGMAHFTVVVRWDGNESGSRFIYNQPEGQVWHTQLNLPPYFKGELSFNLYTEQGKEYINPNFLGSDDFVLLDNLMLKTATSASQESSENQGVLIAPNPAAQTARIQTKVPMKSIRLFNAAGQLIQSLSVRSYSRDLDLSELSKGLYWVGIQLENGNESVQKLVKLD